MTPAPAARLRPANYRSVPIDLAMSLAFSPCLGVDNSDGKGEGIAALKMIRIIRLAKLLKLVRLLKVSDFVENMQVRVACVRGEWKRAAGRRPHRPRATAACPLAAVSARL